MKKGERYAAQGAQAAIVLRLEKEFMDELVAMAKESGMPLSIYLRLMAKQHIRTPLEITLPRPIRRKASVPTASAS